MVILYDFCSSFGKCLRVFIYRYTIPMGIFVYILSVSVNVNLETCIQPISCVHMNHATIYIHSEVSCCFFIRICVEFTAKLYNALLHRIYLLHTHTSLVTKSVDATLDFCLKMIHIIFTRHSAQHNTAQLSSA